jgi:hypothetical protein
MGSNHTLLTIGAFIILMSLLVNFYGVIGFTGDDISSSQDMILATTITTSYIEIAKGLAFDAVTDTSDLALTDPNLLSSVLGPESGEKDSLYKFNDFDDFNGFGIEKAASGTTRKFTTTCSVNYVDPNNIGAISINKTFAKRLDLKTWRSYPPAPIGAQVDTLKLSFVMGYFHFD